MDYLKIVYHFSRRNSIYKSYGIGKISFPKREGGGKADG